MSAVLNMPERAPVMTNRNFTIASSAVLLDVSVRMWTGRKLDKTTTKEVTDAKNAGSSKAASVTKNLLADDADLDAIRAYAQETRVWVAKNTLSWGDGGTRLLPTANLFNVQSELEARQQQFDALVQKFVAAYNLKVSAAAFKLGTLFKRHEYPTDQQVARRFEMRWVIQPVPTAGDFRVDVQNEGAEFLQKQFDREVNSRVQTMLREPWERVYSSLTHIRERLEESIKFAESGPGEGENERKRAPKLYASMLDNAMEQCVLLDKLNVLGDPDLRDVAQRMRRLLSNLTIESIRESDELKRSTKAQVDAILKQFDFSDIEMGE